MIKLRITIRNIIEDANGQKSVQWYATTTLGSSKEAQTAHNGINRLDQEFGLDIEVPQVRIHQHYPE